MLSSLHVSARLLRTAIAVLQILICNWLFHLMLTFSYSSLCLFCLLDSEHFCFSSCVLVLFVPLPVISWQYRPSCRVLTVVGPCLLRRVELLMDLHLRATGRHLPYGITQCCLPPDRSEQTLRLPQLDRPVLSLPTPEILSLLSGTVLSGMAAILRMTEYWEHWYYRLFVLFAVFLSNVSTVGNGFFIDVRSAGGYRCAVMCSMLWLTQWQWCGGRAAESRL